MIKFVGKYTDYKFNERVGQATSGFLYPSFGYLVQILNYKKRRVK